VTAPVVTATVPPAGPPATAPTSWTTCANEGGTCTFSGTRQVRFGQNGVYVARTATASLVCSVASFGADPVPHVAKQCQVADVVEVVSPNAAWVKCAGEGGTCAITGTRTVRFGQNGRYLTRSVTTSTVCNAATFGGDPAPGVVKQCDVDYSQTAALPLANWNACGVENASCTFSGARLIRYGAGVSYGWRVATESILCSNAVWGDTAPSQVKRCEIQP
jgi:hypothetical protein